MTSTTTLPPEPVLWIIWFRPGKGHRWKKAGRAATHAEAMAAVGGRGDWHIAPLYDKRLAGEPEANLFTEDPSDE